jgi:hypothetical protein
LFIKRHSKKKTGIRDFVNQYLGALFGDSEMEVSNQFEQLTDVQNLSELPLSLGYYGHVSGILDLSM